MGKERLSINEIIEQLYKNVYYYDYMIGSVAADLTKGKDVQNYENDLANYEDLTNRRDVFLDCIKYLKTLS